LGQAAAGAADVRAIMLPLLPSVLTLTRTLPLAGVVAVAVAVAVELLPLRLSSATLVESSAFNAFRFGLSSPNRFLVEHHAQTTINKYETEQNNEREANPDSHH